MNEVFKLKTYPENTMIFSDMDRVDYFDSYGVARKTTETVKEITHKILKGPAWVGYLMQLRDFVVRPFGLKTEDKIKKVQLDSNSEFDFAPILFSNDNEIIMGMNDKHLYFRLSVLKVTGQENTQIFLTTVVRFNNWGGRIYFAVIRIFHGLIVRTMLKRL